MPHKDWCGRNCQKCEHCYLYMSLFCPPDCPNMAPDGKFTDKCLKCEDYHDMVVNELLDYDEQFHYPIEIVMHKLKKLTRRSP